MNVLRTTIYMVANNLKKQKLYAYTYLMAALCCEAIAILLLVMCFDPQTHNIAHPILISTVSIVGFSFSAIYLLIHLTGRHSQF